MNGFFTTNVRVVIKGVTSNGGLVAETSREAEPERERTFGVEPITAWRVWRIVNYALLDGRTEPRLAPLSVGLLWQPRQRITSICALRPVAAAHESPHPDCTCGFWAVEESIAETLWASQLVPSALVMGTVAMWGRVLEFERGYRAQHAYPSSFHGYADQEEVVRELGEVYGVPVVNRCERPPRALKAPTAAITISARQAAVTLEEMSRRLAQCNLRYQR